MQNLVCNQRAIIAAFFTGKASAASQASRTVFTCLLLFMAGSFNSFAQTDTWVQKNDLGYGDINVPEPIQGEGAVGFSIAGKGYIGTGFNTSGLTKDFWEYDPVANTWTQKADFRGTARAYAVGFSIAGKGYIGMGNAFFTYYKDFWEYDPAANAWTRKADFGGTARNAAVGFSIGSKGYIGTGEYYGSASHFYKDFWQYDPAADAWTRKADFGGTARSGAVGFSIGSKGYIGTGGDKDFWEYDPAADAWTRKADFGGTVRSGAVGFSISGKGYIGTGGHPYTKDFWEYDPAANDWTQKVDFGGTARRYAVGFNISGKGYIGTGSNDFGSDKDFWEYEPTANAWTQKADFGGTARCYAVGFSIGSKGYIGTGYDLNFYMKDFWEHDPVGNTWTQKADFGGTARYGAVGFSIGNKGYVGTGYYQDNDNHYQKDFWEYDPATNMWTQKADFGGTARRYAVGFSIGNKGYIGTGFYYDNDIHYLKDFWEYSPVANAWTQKADFGGSAHFSAVGFSIAGKGYIGTGMDNRFVYQKDFWEYNPAADTWTRKADFGGAARYQAVGFSISGKGYIGTGRLSNGNEKDFWEYNPSTDAWTQKADFRGTARYQAVGFSISGKGYIGTGYDIKYKIKKDFWEYTPAGCPDPYNLRVPKIADTCARLNWNVPDASVEHIKISYRQLGGSTWIEDRKKSLENSKVICGLTPNTTYEWKVRNICADEKTGWVKGPNFTTLASTTFSLNAITINGNKVQNNISANIIPNPNKGNFILQMQLPHKATSSTLSLYNCRGEKIWQQDAGRLSGSVNINIALENKLSPGLYVLLVQRGNERVIQKVVVMK